MMNNNHIILYYDFHGALKYNSILFIIAIIIFDIVWFFALFTISIVLLVYGGLYSIITRERRGRMDVVVLRWGNKFLI